MCTVNGRFLANSATWLINSYLRLRTILCGKKMRLIIGIASFIAGLCIWGVAITALLSWLAFCFGSVIIGVLLLIFAPYVLLAPLAIATPGTALLVYGMDCVANNKKDSIF